MYNNIDTTTQPTGAYSTDNILTYILAPLSGFSERQIIPT